MAVGIDGSSFGEDGVTGNGVIVAPDVVGREGRFRGLNNVVARHDISGKLCCAFECVSDLVVRSVEEARAVLHGCSQWAW